MLKIKDLTCGYDSGFMLKDINLQIEQEEFTGIIGPNGSGKTTLLKSITGLLKPKSGEILLQEKNIRSRGYKELAKTNLETMRKYHIDNNIKLFEQLT